jgi:hypothetical protein
VRESACRQAVQNGCQQGRSGRVNPSFVIRQTGDPHEIFGCVLFPHRMTVDD